MRCVFCGWAASGSRSLVFEDDDTFAGVDPRQPYEGHVLVIPRLHVPTVFDLDEVVAAAVMRTTVRIAKAVKATFAPKGLSLWQSNGPAAFQEVPHFHMHVMPRWHGDDLLRIYPGEIRDLDLRGRELQAERIRAHLD